MNEADTAPAAAGRDLAGRLQRLLAAAVPPLTHAVFGRTPLHFDRRHGVDTQGHVIDAATGALYAPISVKHFHHALGLVPLPPGDATFLDLGSGKGRAVLLAAGYPFRRVIGVEQSAELHAVAERNLRRYRGRRAARVDLVIGDATTVALPDGDVVVFFYNSFAGAPLRRLLDHLAAEVAGTARRLVFLYSNPVDQAAFAERPAYRLIADSLSAYDLLWWGNRRVTVYTLNLAP